MEEESEPRAAHFATKGNPPLAGPLWDSPRVTTIVVTAKVTTESRRELPLHYLYAALANMLAQPKPQFPDLVYVHHGVDSAGDDTHRVRRGTFPRVMTLRIKVQRMGLAPENRAACVMLWPNGSVHVSGLHGQMQVMFIEDSLMAMLRHFLPAETLTWTEERPCLCNMIVRLADCGPNATRFAGERIVRAFANSPGIDRMLWVQYEPEVFSGTAIAYQPACTETPCKGKACDCHRVTILLQRRGVALVYGARTHRRALEAWQWFLDHCSRQTQPIPLRPQGSP